MKKPNAYTLDHQRDVWRTAYNAAFASTRDPYLAADRALAEYIQRWPLD